MLASEVNASDLAFLCCSLAAGTLLSMPLAFVTAVARGAPPRAKWAGGGRQGAFPSRGEAGQEGRSGRPSPTAPSAVGPERASDASYAAQLRRTAPIVSLFSAAQPGGEKEAAYHALARIAAKVNAARRRVLDGQLVTPGLLYRDLTDAGRRSLEIMGAPAFDARIYAELRWRDTASGLDAA